MFQNSIAPLFRETKFNWRKNYDADSEPGFEKGTGITDVILKTIKAQGGFMPVTGKTPPEEIYRLFGVSKKTYKQAIGALYKKRLITFENNGRSWSGNNKGCEPMDSRADAVK